MNEPVTQKCQYCGKEFTYVPKSRRGSGNSERKYCAFQCAILGQRKHHPWRNFKSE
jgi:hypothetical protein